MDQILIIEDDPDIRFVITRALKDRARFSFAITTDDAMTTFVNATFNVVICDYRMEGSLDGIDVLLKMREVDKGCLLILFTNHELGPNELSIMRRHDIKYWRKTETGIDIVGKIDQCLAESRQKQAI